MARRLLRVVSGAAGAAVLCVGLVAGPASATILPPDHYSDDYAFEFDECGFIMDVVGHSEGIAHIRVGKNDHDTAFYLHDN